MGWAHIINIVDVGHLKHMLLTNAIFVSAPMGIIWADFRLLYMNVRDPDTAIIPGLPNIQYQGATLPLPPILPGISVSTGTRHVLRLNYAHIP